VFIGEHLEQARDLRLCTDLFAYLADQSRAQARIISFHVAAG